MQYRRTLYLLIAFELATLFVVFFDIYASDHEGADMSAKNETDKIVKTDAEWREQLTPEQYRVTRQKGTERAFTGKYLDHKAKGVYRCVACGQPLFDSSTKYDSRSGWPSFFAPVEPGTIANEEDRSLFTTRTEVLCSRCGAHLGHLFDDGPPPTGLRYCVNSAALDFEPEEEGAKMANTEPATARATFAAGCFWGVEAAFRKLPGVLDARVGYTGGKTANPSYREVCTDSTGHAEAIEIEYDPSRISYNQLLAAFWEMHDPTTLNRQGPDLGTQYRSAIFFHDADQEAQARASKKALADSGRFPRPIVTEIAPAGPFYPAEEYHQRYLEKRGAATCATEPR